VKSEADGVVVAGGGAAKDTVTVTVPVKEPLKLAALRLETLPHESLPGGGPGHAGGNFVITGVRATVLPPEGAKPAEVRYVRVELPGSDKLLQLAEVEVFGGGVNLAVKGKATQKSTFAEAGAEAADSARVRRTWFSVVGASVGFGFRLGCGMSRSVPGCGR
jgi:hypothetical protein